MTNIFSGGNLRRLTVFALGIMPYISASIILQLLTVVIPSLERLAKEGEAGKKKITQYTRYGTIVLSLVQSFGILFRRLLPRLATTPQVAGEIWRALFVERPAPLLAVRRHLDQQVVDQILHVPCLVRRQVAKAHDKLLHHAHGNRRQRHDMAGDLFRAFHQLRMRHDGILRPSSISRPAT